MSETLTPAVAVASDCMPQGHFVAQPPSDLRATSAYLRACHRALVSRSVLSFAAMLLYFYDYIPLIGLVLANVVLYPTIYLRLHDIGHGTAERAYGWSARFVPVSNPIWGGTRVFATIHREHHKYLGTDHDPWLPYYVGHPLRALFFNFIEPEYSCREFVRRHGVDRELVFNWLFHAATVVGGLAVFQWAYVAHLISQRVVHAVGIFFFNFYTHRETISASAPIGTWERAGDLQRVLPMLRAIWGADVIDGLVFHNRHHCIGQQHVPVQHYKYLQDTGDFTRFETVWPITRIRTLKPTSLRASPFGPMK